MHCEYSSEENDNYEDNEMFTSNYICLMCDREFNDALIMFAHVKEQHNVDIKEILNVANIKDEYDWIKLVNYLRKNINGLNVENIKSNEWRSDIYFQPSLENDNLLFLDFTDFINCSIVESTDLKDTILAQENTIAILRNKLSELLDNDKEMVVQETDVQNQNRNGLTSEDKAYFTGYSHYSIHDTMIKDKVRTESYRQFIEENGSRFFKDKVVLDVGCGTGILSIFAARAGAKHVYGVDCADVIFEAMGIVEANGFKDKITLVHGKLEEVGIPCEKVDVVISEWMGYFLIYESMLDSVLYACRKYLNRDTGLVFPRFFSLSVCGADMGAYRRDNVDCWDSVYGIDMSCMKSNVLKEVIVDVVPPGDVMTSSCVIREYDIQQMAFDDSVASPQIIESAFEIVCDRDGSLGSVVAYFDTFFMSPRGDQSEQVMFSTGPMATPTHWQQVALLLREPIEVKKSQRVSGLISIDRHKYGRRGLDIVLTVDGGRPQRFEFS